MSLVKLPKELLLMVTDQLPLSSIESLALTLNKHITPVVLPRLKSLFAQRKHVKKMEAVFGGLCFALEIGVGGIEQTRERLDIPSDAQLEEPSELQRLERLKYLDLKEDLHWLRPLDEYTAARMAPHNTHTVLDEKEIAELEKDAKSVNITLPPSFLKFMSNSELMIRIPSMTANYFRISGGLRKVPKDIDGGAGGYSISMYSDQQGCGYWDLYLAPGENGGHCVLGDVFDSGYTISDVESSDEAKAEKEKDPGREMATMNKGDVSLAGASFEQWLVLNYFEQWLWFVLQFQDNVKPVEALKEYVRHMYVKR